MCILNIVLTLLFIFTILNYIKIECGCVRGDVGILSKLKIVFNENLTLEGRRLWLNSCKLVCTI